MYSPVTMLLGPTPRVFVASLVKFGTQVKVNSRTLGETNLFTKAVIGPAATLVMVGASKEPMITELVPPVSFLSSMYILFDDPLRTLTR